MVSISNLMLLQLPLGPEHLLTDPALLRVLGVVDLQVKAQGSNLLEAFLALRALEDAFHRVYLKSIDAVTIVHTIVVTYINST